MDQTSSTALIVSIVAAVLGALGLVGGIIGYVQGTAALRRATLTRQRAAAAEEAALGAKAQAEQSARIAQDALDRISRLQLRSLGDVADQPTGPLLLPPRAVLKPVTAPTVIGAAPERTALTTGPAEEEPDASPVAPEETPTGPIAVQSSEPTAVQSSEQPVAAAQPESAPSDLEVTQAEAPVESVAAPETGPVAVEEETVTEAGPSAVEEEASSETGPVPVQEEPSAVTGPVVVQAPAPEQPRAPRHATGPIPIGTASAAPRGPIPAPSDEAHENTLEAEASPAAVPAVEPEGPTASTDAGAEESPARSSTGQVTAGVQEAPPMDWAEVLRTGAIPLPTMSRGTYAAPAKSRKVATGPARFEIRAVGRQSFEVVNVGAEEAQLVSVEGTGEDRHLVRPIQTRPVAVAPGGSLAFSLLRVEGRQVSVEVTWQREGEDRSTELAVP